jgi:hypothetical protein
MSEQIWLTGIHVDLPNPIKVRPRHQTQVRPGRTIYVEGIDCLVVFHPFYTSFRECTDFGEGIPQIAVDQNRMYDP